MRPPKRLHAWLLLAAALAPSSALGAGLQGQPLGPGDVVRVDLSKVPKTVARRGQATCLGARRTATGDMEEVRCQRPFTFELPFQGVPLVLVFQPKGKGAPARLEYPVVQERRPRTFTAPGAGTLSQVDPAPRPAAGPEKLTPEQLAQARGAAAVACERCEGAPTFTLQEITVEEARVEASPIQITIEPAPAKAR